MTKKYKIPKLALELIGYIFTSLIISVFSYSFLYFISIAIGEKALENGYPSAFSYLDPSFLNLLRITCILASVVVFFTFFLFFLGQKIAYILSITHGVNLLKEGNLNFQIETLGDDELTNLADTINSLSIALQNHKENEERLLQEKEILIKSLSHDIRTPLTAIISYSDFIENNKYNNHEELLKYINIIQNKSHQIEELTRLILNNKQIHTNSNNRAILDGKLMFEQFINEFVWELEDNNFDVEVNKLGLVNFETTINDQDIVRIFDNLYSNIIKYADEKEKVYLNVFLMNGMIVLNQSNYIKNSFDKYVESNSIGLKNVKQIIESYNGYMDVMSSDRFYKIQLKISIKL